MSHSNVLIVGLSGLGCEIAKNLILAGDCPLREEMPMSRHDACHAPFERDDVDSRCCMRFFIYSYLVGLRHLEDTASP